MSVQSQAERKRARAAVKRAALIPLLLCASVAQGAGDPVAGEAKAASCFGCHGPQGNSENPLFPKLAQQHASYFVKQVADLQSGRRKHEIMTPMSNTVTDEDVEDIAAYFAAQTRTRGKADPELKQIGERIYYAGNDASGAVACFPCHGPAGLGSDPKVFPNIAGQHAAYVEKILKDFRSGVRKNDRENLMQNTVVQLNDKEIAAVAQYVQGLPYPEAEGGMGYGEGSPCQYPNCPPVGPRTFVPPISTPPKGGRQRLRSGDPFWPDGQ